MATLTQTGQTTSSVTVTCSGLDPNHRFTRYFWWQIYLNGTKIAEYGDSLAPYSSSHTGSFSGLTASTAYTVQCGIYNDSAYTELLALLSCQADTSAAPTPATVNCYAVRWYDGTQDQVFGPYSMTPGSTYFVSTYMPSYDSTRYELDSVMLNGVTPVTGAAFIAPSSNFSLDFYFVSKQKVNGTIRRYEDGTLKASYGPIEFTVGSTFTVADYMPYVDPAIYTLDHVEKDGVTITAASFTVPNTDFIVSYYFVSSTNAYIWDGSQWVPAVAYIWDGSQWVRARANIYSSGWQS